MAEELGRERDFLVIAGQEVSAREGDILAFGLESEGLYGISSAELCRIAMREGAVLIPAHPYRRFVNALGSRLFDYPACFSAIEGLNGNCSSDENWSAQVAAEEMVLPIVGGSDAHSLGMVGRFYTVFDPSYAVTDLDSLITALRSGVYQAEENENYSYRSPRRLF